ncbi:DinB family protein [Arthrobacter sp. 35W]|uniref:DinB family protein n=1 Tax=Arthrobacter sp. 35W TaxID=1132441 RepID=UPI0004093D38|nr:DinB family protein [Arthrobacter sp. 35W]
MYRTVPGTGDEKTSLLAALDRHRDAILWKIDGVDDAGLRRPMTPSGTNLLGLVQHLAAVEYGWFCETFGRPTEPLPFDEDDENADLRVPEGTSTADVLAFYARARAAADAVIAEVGLEETGTAWGGDAVSMRWVLIHMLEETARHAGHVDILRELIDGATGDHNRG